MLSILTAIFFLIVGWLSYDLPANSLIIDAPTAVAEEIQNNKQTGSIEINCDLSARSGIAVNLDTQQELCSKQPDQVASIASITKLVSALVFLDNNPGWDTIYRIKHDDRREGGRIYLFSGDEITAKDLFYNALVASDNTAIIGLVNLTNMTEKEFTNKMNEKVKSLGLRQTVFVEPTGLSSYNRSTAREVAKFAKVALSKPEIKQAVLSTKYKFTTKQGKIKSVYSTGQLLASQLHGFQYLGGKTGYLIDSGYCFVGLFNKGEQQVITVILGADSKQARFSQTEEILNAFSTVNN
jgi:D-alanyl-D-alanine carboxypeptidase